MKNDSHDHSNDEMKMAEAKQKALRTQNDEKMKKTKDNVPDTMEDNDDATTFNKLKEAVSDEFGRQLNGAEAHRLLKKTIKKSIGSVHINEALFYMVQIRQPKSKNDCLYTRVSRPIK